MNIFDITPASAYVNAIEAAAQNHSQTAERRPPLVATTPGQGRLAIAVRAALARLAKAAAGLQALAYSRSRTA